MDHFRLYGFLDDIPFLIPHGPFAPREAMDNNQLAGPALPSQYPDIGDSEENLHNPLPFYTCSAVSTAGPLDVEPHSLDNDPLTVPSCEQRHSQGFLLYPDVNSCWT
jgi:hypothetical protein